MMGQLLQIVDSSGKINQGTAAILLLQLVIICGKINKLFAIQMMILHVKIDEMG